MKKATPEQRAAYRGVYPLHGFITIAGRLAMVEYVGDKDNGIGYEVLCPDGFHFEFEGTHTHLCANAREVNDCTRMTLTACTHAAGCDVPDEPAL